MNFYFYLPLLILWYALFLYVNPGFWAILFSFSLKKLFKTFFSRQIYWQQISSIFICLEKSISSLLFIYKFEYTELYLCVLFSIFMYLFSILNVSIHSLLVCMVSERSVILMYNALFPIFFSQDFIFIFDFCSWKMIYLCMISCHFFFLLGVLRPHCINSLMYDINFGKFFRYFLCFCLLLFLLFLFCICYIFDTCTTVFEELAFFQICFFFLFFFFLAFQFGGFLLNYS